MPVQQEIADATLPEEKALEDTTQITKDKAAEEESKTTTATEETKDETLQSNTPEKVEIDA